MKYGTELVVSNPRLHLAMQGTKIEIEEDGQKKIIDAAPKCMSDPIDRKLDKELRAKGEYLVYDVKEKEWRPVKVLAIEKGGLMHPIKVDQKPVQKRMSLAEALVILEEHNILVEKVYSKYEVNGIRMVGRDVVKRAKDLLSMESSKESSPYSEFDVDNYGESEEVVEEIVSEKVEVIEEVKEEPKKSKKSRKTKKVISEIKEVDRIEVEAPLEELNNMLPEKDFFDDPMSVLMEGSEKDLFDEVEI